MSPEQYFNSLGIDLKTMGVFAVVDGHLRQIDICHHLEEYAKLANPTIKHTKLLDLEPDELKVMENKKSPIPEYYPGRFKCNKKN